jgi:hypothetical protein
VKFSSRARLFAAILVVVFILTSIWAGYYLYAATHPSGGSSSGTTVATYAESSVGAFAAAVRPSYLYNNSTVVYGGDVMLFTPITNWINASIDYTLQTNRTVVVSLAETFSVTISTAVWSKTLFTSLNRSSSPATTSIELTTAYDVNVSAVIALVSAIDNQLGYQTFDYTLSLNPVISGSVEVSGIAQQITSQPGINFTFDGPLITPSGLVYASQGSIVAPTLSGPSSGLAGATPYLALIGSVGGLCGSTWVATRREQEERVPPLDKLIEPYEEAIAITARTPPSVAETPVATFADLVKIADTLGKPILRPMESDRARDAFIVLDGLTAFTYRYPHGGAVSAESTEQHSPGPGPVWSPAAIVLVQRLQQEVARLYSPSVDAASAADARRRVRRAMELIRAGAEAESADEIDELARFLTAAAATSKEKP